MTHSGMLAASAHALASANQQAITCQPTGSCLPNNHIRRAVATGLNQSAVPWSSNIDAIAAEDDGAWSYSLPSSILLNHFCFVLFSSTHFLASGSSFCSFSVPRTTLRRMVEGDMVRCTMAVKFQERHPPVPPHPGFPACLIGPFLTSIFPLFTVPQPHCCSRYRRWPSRCSCPLWCWGPSGRNQHVLPPTPFCSRR